MNPYLVPGLEATPYAPLCPHVNEDHHVFYVPVDDTENEFCRFQRTMNSVQRLTERGLLVVVTGKSGCGKTSLINRCAAWLRDELAEGQVTADIFPLSDAGAPDQSIMLRMEQVVTDLVEMLRDERYGVGSMHLDLLARRVREIEEIEESSDRQTRHAAKVDRVYKYLHDALPADRIAIVLLPPSADLVNEIKSYASFARHRRIVFFAETDSVDALHRIWPTIPSHDNMRPILLQVGPLNPEDAWTYALARQGSDSDDAGFPTVSEMTMRRVAQGGLVSIGRLHRLLHGVYSEEKLPPLEVSYEHIAGYFFRRMFPESGGIS